MSKNINDFIKLMKKDCVNIIGGAPGVDSAGLKKRTKKHSGEIENAIEVENKVIDRGKSFANNRKVSLPVSSRIRGVLDSFVGYCIFPGECLISGPTSAKRSLNGLKLSIRKGQMDELQRLEVIERLRIQGYSLARR